MPNVPRSRYQNYGTAPRRTVYGTITHPTGYSYSNGGEQVSLGGHTDALLISYGHKAPYARNIWNGGDFYTTQVGTQHTPGSMNVTNVYYSIGSYRYAWRSTGNCFATNVPPAAGGILGYDAIRSIMVPLGTVGWNRFRPGKPTASVSQFIAELRQLPKNPFRLAAATAKAVRRFGANSARGVDEMRRAVGDQYLNYSFGWRPFLADLEKIADFDNSLASTMRQLRRDHGRTVRREGTVASDTTTTSFSQTSGSPIGYIDGPYTSGGSGGSKRDVSTTTSWRCWFSAGFVYHLPREDDPNSMDRLRTYLKGGGISPSIVWELTPWSWLADYFTNIGNVLENWEASRELALAAKYCYVMYEREVRVTSSHTGWGNHSGGWTCSGSWSSWSKMKARTWASPYGLGFTSGSLNDSQKANLAALGLSRRI